MKRQNQPAGGKLATPSAMFQPKVAPLLAVGAATLGAIWTIPDDPLPAGNLFIPALLMTVALVFGWLYGAWRQPKRLLLIVPLAALGTVYWLLLDLLQGAYDLTLCDRDDVRLAFITIGLFCAGIWVGSMFSPPRLPTVLVRAASNTYSRDHLFLLVLVSFCLGMFYYGYSSDFSFATLIDGLLQPRNATPWSRTSKFGDAKALLEQMTLFGCLVPGLTVLLARRAGWLSWSTVLGLLMSVVVLAFIAQGGNRRLIGVVVGIAITLWLVTAKRVRFKELAVVGVLAIALLAFMQFVLVHRTAGLGNWLSGTVESEGPSHLHVDDNFLRLSQTIRLIPSQSPHAGWQLISWVVTRPIPRVLWPNKPSGIDFDLTEAVGLFGVSLSSSVIGELYFSGGLLGVLLGGLLYGFLARWLGGLTRFWSTDGGALLYGGALMAIFAGIRSMHDLVMMSYIIVAWLLLVLLVGGTRRQTGQAASGKPRARRTFSGHIEPRRVVR